MRPPRRSKISWANYFAISVFSMIFSQSFWINWFLWINSLRVLSVVAYCLSNLALSLINLLFSLNLLTRVLMEPMMFLFCQCKLSESSSASLSDFFYPPIYSTSSCNLSSNYSISFDLSMSAVSNLSFNYCSIPKLSFAVKLTFSYFF